MAPQSDPSPADGAKVDGRRARGDRRKRELVDAAMAVLGRDGIAGVTHRAVAEEAGVPLASASYHFAGIEDLIANVIERVRDDLIARLATTTPEPGVDGLARFMAEDLASDHGFLLVGYEQYLYLARRDRAARLDILAWLDDVCATFAPELDAAQRRALKATIDGLYLHAIIGAHPLSEAEIAQTLRLAWPGGTAP